MEGFTVIEADPVLPRNWPCPSALSFQRSWVTCRSVLILADRPGRCNHCFHGEEAENAFECGTVDLQSIDGLDIKACPAAVPAA